MSFPVYRLIKTRPLENQGVLYYSNTYFDTDTSTYKTYIKIIDDRNINEQTLSRRRLRAKALGAPLYPLRRAIFFLGDFIMLAKSQYWFIDSNGKLFQYTKSKRVKLTFKKIKRKIPFSTGSILELEGIPHRFKTLYPVKDSMKYAGILKDGLSYTLYGVYPAKYKDTWRLI